MGFTLLKNVIIKIKISSTSGAFGSNLQRIQNNIILVLKAIK